MSGGIVMTTLRADGEPTPIAASSKGKKILLMSFGSRGDTQPMSALAVHLQTSGFEVVVTTNVDHVDFFASSGVKAHGVHFNIKEFMLSDSMVKAMVRRRHSHQELAAVHPNGPYSVSRRRQGG